MGRHIHEALSGIGIATTIIEPHLDERDEPMDGVIVGKATQANLQAAGVKDAAGIVAGTHTDSDNLSILVNARALRPEVFVIVRQNLHMNQVVFQAAQADFIMQPSLVSARRILFILIAPLLKSFFEQLRDRANDRDDSFVADMITQLRETVGGTNPRIWTVDTAVQPVYALTRLADRGVTVSLGDLLRDPVDRDRRLACVPLVVQDENGETVLPGDYHPVPPGSQILLCGTSRAQWMLDATLNNEYTLRYLITGIDAPRGIVMRWLSRRLNGAAAAPAASDLAQSGDEYQQS
jgi:hypothetical protein